MFHQHCLFMVSEPSSLNQSALYPFTLMLYVTAFTLYILSAVKVFMALNCVHNYLGEHACTKYNTHLCYSGQQNNVPTITVYCARKLCYKQLSSLLFSLYSQKMITRVTWFWDVYN